MKSKKIELFGGIEAGGTKFVCAVGNSLGEILERENFPTTAPKEIMQRVNDYLAKLDAKYHFSALIIYLQYGNRPQQIQMR
jgi:predicted NBD/HSP70 family sugar kinase